MSPQKSKSPANRVLVSLLVLISMASMPRAAHAHKPSDSYLTLSVDTGPIRGRWDIALRDLEYALGLDSDLDGAISWGELQQQHQNIAAFALAHLRVTRDGVDCVATPRRQLVDRHSDGAYSVLEFEFDCPRRVGTVAVDYRLFFDLDPTHRGLLRVRNGASETTLVLSPAAPTAHLGTDGTGTDGTGTDGIGPWRQLASYWRQGVWHIWIGYDHILFLLALLLPAVLRREGRSWRPVGGFRKILVRVAGVVTAFTVAHSVTLAVAALGWVSLPSRWIEATIAATVMLAALNNLFPIFGEKPWRAAFLLGLIHGFGFATVLRDLGLPDGALARALAGFNLGVETGQLAIVTAFLPLAYLLRNTRLYRHGVVVLGSVLVATIALVWFVERSLNLQLLSF